MVVRDILLNLVHLKKTLKKPQQIIKIYKLQNHPFVS